MMRPQPAAGLEFQNGLYPVFGHLSILAVGIGFLSVELKAEYIEGEKSGGIT